MTCEECQREQSRFVDGELPASQSADMMMHTSTCAGCRQFLSALVRLNTEVARLPQMQTVRPQTFEMPRGELFHEKNFWQRRFTLRAPVFALTVLAVAILAVLSSYQFRRSVPVYVTELPTLVISADSTAAGPGQSSVK